MNSLSQLQSRYLALGLFVVAVSIAVAAMCWPWLATHSAQAAELEHKQRQIAVYRGLAASEGSMQQQLTALQRRNPAAGFYVTGDTPALASARMQQYVRQVVDQNGGELISTQVAASDESTGNVTRLSVHLRADIGALPQILYMLESGKPLLVLDDMTISARLVRAVSAGSPPRVSLDMNFDVTGYLQEDAG
jgi:general secretion pathway protein M